MNSKGLHHVTAIATDPQRNLDFYTGILGLRLVKRTVNFDDPGTYHFYFGDEQGSPGSILTFFPWPNARQGRRGAGETAATAFSVNADDLPAWKETFQAKGIAFSESERFGQRVLQFRDPDGLALELVGDVEATAGKTEIDGFSGVTLAVEEIAPTAAVLTEVFGYRPVGTEGRFSRFASSADEIVPGRIIDLYSAPGEGHGQGGAGSVHHIAFRAGDAQEQEDIRRVLVKRGLGVSPVMDRTYFQSIYFREPGGVLFEVATDAPGFALDEPVERLGEGLMLPSWLESSRARIEAILPPISVGRKN